MAGFDPSKYGSKKSKIYGSSAADTRVDSGTETGFDPSRYGDSKSKLYSPGSMVITPEPVETQQKKRERQVVSPYGTFLGGFSFAGDRQKTAKELADEKAQQELSEQEYQRLLGLELDKYRTEVEKAEKKAQEEKAPYNIRAFGGYDANRTTEAERQYAAMKADLNKAESLQYDVKGREALDKLTEEQTAALEVLASTEGVPAAAAQADYDRKVAARETLLASGLSEDELSQLVNYQRNIPKREKNAERYAKVQEMARNEGEKSPIGGTLLSVPANLLSGIGTVYTAVEKLRNPDTPADYHSPAMLPYAYASGVRGEVTKNLQYDHGDAAAFAYGVGTSMLDSAATAALAALGVPPAAASATLGGAAATDAMVAAKDRGLDDSHAIVTGVAAGVMESFFEKVSLESLIHMKLPTGTAKQKLAGMLKNAAIQGGIEGSEEMFTDLANLWWDKVINGDMADVEQRINAYMAGGMSHQEAQQKVVGETIKDIAVDFGAGALAGGLMGGGNMAVQTAVQHSNELTAERYRQFLQEAGVQLDDQQSAEDTALTEASDKYGAQAEVFRSTYAEGQDVALYDSAYRIAYEYGKAGAKEEAVMQQEDLSYLSETQRKIAYIAGREAAAWQNGLGENGGKAWAEVQNADVESKGKLQAGFTVLYQAGLRRESAANVKSEAASALPQSVQTAAYEAGLSDAAASLAREKAGLDFVSSAGSESGLVDNEHSRKMAKDQAGTAALLNTLGKNLGVRIEMVDTISGGKANGVYISSRNLIQIAADADNAFGFVAAHEVTHRMQELAPEEYRAYRDHAMSYRARESGEEGAAAYVVAYMAKAEEAGVKLTQEEAMDEIAADFTRDMMENGNLFEDFAKENRSAAKKLLDALKAFIAKVKSLFRSKTAQDRAAQDAYGKSMAELEQCAALWQKAYDAAGKQAQKAKTAAREGDGDGRYQIKYPKYAESDITENSVALQSMDAVAQLTGNELGGRDIPLKTRIQRYFDSLDNNLRTERFGDVALSNSSVRSEIRHGHTPRKIETYAAIPYVLDRGVVIYQAAKNEHGLERIVVAAPVEVGKMPEKMYVGVMLQRDPQNQRLYLHDVVTEKESATGANGHLITTGPNASDGELYTTDILRNALNVKKKFSLKTDSTGRQLTEQQQEYFKNSKVRDAEGRLKTVYHGSSAQFTKFSADFMSQNGSSEGQGFYFTDLKTMAQGYEKGGGQLLEGYLDIKNPLSDSEVTLSNAEVKRLIMAIDPTGDDLVLNYDSRGGMGYPSRTWYNRAVNDTLRMTMETSESDSEILAELANGMGDPGAVLKAAREVLGYDGYIVEGKYDDATVYVAFDSSQFKNVDNKKPTGDPDIRFQLKSATELEQEVRELKKERRALENRNRVLTERVAKWRGELRRTETPSVRPGDVKKLGRQFLSDYGSSSDYRAIEGDMTALGKALMADDVSMDTLRPHARAAAEKIIDGVLVQAESGGELLAIRDHLKNVTLRYTDDGSIPDFKDWRRANRRTLKISDKSGLDVDVAYSELTEMFGEGYFPSTIIHPGDQLLRMSEVLDNVGRIYENPFDGFRDAAVTELSNLLIDGMIGEDVRQSNPTFADRQALELQETKARLTQMLIKTREGRDRQVERMRRHYQEQTKAGRERRNATALRAKIARHTADLSRKLLTPTDKQHIPEKLRQSVAALLGSINQESAYSIKPGTEHYVIHKDGTRGGLSGEHVANGEGLPTARTQAAIALKNAYDEILRSGEALVIDPDLLGSEGAGLLDQVMAFGNKRIADMNSEELTTVWQAVRAIERSVSTFNKNLAIERYAGVQELAEALRDGTFSRKRANRKLALDLYDPYTFFYAYGEAGMQVYRTLRNAQDKQNTMLKTIQAAAEKFMDKEVYKNRLERHEFFVGEDGQRLVLTTGQIMNLYNLVGRGEQAVHHLTVGGVVQPAIKKNGKQAAIERGTENIRLTVDDLTVITGTLTEAQRKVAEGFQKIASGDLAKWGNEASMTVYGYQKFTEGKYWPVKAAQEGTTQNSEKGADVAREIKNMGSAKALTPNASNALEIGDMYDVFAQNASDMIQYSTLLAPMEDINRLYNYRYRDAKGNLTGKNVKHVLTDVYGEAAQKYWRNLMRDVQNGMGSTGTDTTRFIEKMVGGVKGASVGFNLRVVAQQPTAYIRAAAILDPSAMAKGIVGGATEGNGWEKAKKYAPIASIKDTAGFDQSSRYSIAQNVYGSEGGALEWLNDKSGWLAGKADAVTWGAIWNACEWTVVNEGGYEKGSDAFFSRVAQVFTEVIDQSQVVDGIMQRTQIMRDANGLTKQATAFMGEPLKTLNMFMRSYDAWRFEQNIPKRSAAMKKMTRTIGAVLVTDVVNALAQSVMDAFRDDDKDKGYGERYLEKLTGFTGDKEKDTFLSVLLGSNIWDNADPLGRIPYAKDIKSLMQGFTVSRMDADAAGDFITAAEGFVKSLQGEGKKTPLYAAKQLLTAGSKIFGVSVANMGRDVWAIARSIAQSSGNIRVMYEMERAIWRLAPDAGNNTRYYKLLYMAMEQDKEAYQYIYEDMKKRGYSDGQLQKGIKSVIQDSGASDTDMRKQLEEIGYSGEEAQEVMDKWEATSNAKEWFGSGTERYVARAYTDYAEPAGIDRDMFLDFYREASRTSGEDLDGDGKTDSGSKKKKVLALIDGMALSATQKDALYYQQGYAESTIGDAPWH
jgi:hypothetical protein